MSQKWVISHIWIRHVTHMSESRDICSRHVTHTNPSCHTRTNSQHPNHTPEWVMSHVWIRVTSLIWIRHVTNMTASRHTYTGSRSRTHTHEWVMSHVWIRVTSLIRMSHVTHMTASRHTHTQVVILQPIQMNESCSTHIWLIHTCDMTHSNVWHHSCIWMSHAPHIQIRVMLHIRR